MSQIEITLPSLFKNKSLVVIILVAAAIAVGLAGTLNTLIALAGVVFFSLSVLFIILKWPNFTIIFVTFIIYTNTAVVMIKFHGVPEVVGYALPILLLIPFIWQVIVYKRKIRINL